MKHFPTLTATALALCAVLASSPASARLMAEANVAKSEGQWGGEFGAGYSIIDIDGFKITPAGGVFIYDRDTSGLIKDSSSTTGCVVEATGAPVKENRCDSTATKLYGRIEASYSLPVMGLTVGTGARLFSGKLRPYGTVSMPLVPMIHAKANAGPKYVSAGLQARF